MAELPSTAMAVPRAPLAVKTIDDVTGAVAGEIWEGAQRETTGVVTVVAVGVAQAALLGALWFASEQLPSWAAALLPLFSVLVPGLSALAWMVRDAGAFTRACARLEIPAAVAGDVAKRWRRWRYFRILPPDPQARREEFVRAVTSR